MVPAIQCKGQYSHQHFTRRSVLFLFFAHAFLYLGTTARGHGVLSFPNQRGTLSGRSRFTDHVIDENAPYDHKAHFPAGDKDGEPGAGQRSQRRALLPRKWTPYTPLTPGFSAWRAGPCGDDVGEKYPAHVKPTNGPVPSDIENFYYGGQIVASYKSGGIIDANVTIVAHHNGFMEFHLCDVEKCPYGEINFDCFAAGHCFQLQRAASRCDDGNMKSCGPIDPQYPGRWYLPCSKYGSNGRKGAWESYGGDGTMLFQLSRDFKCEHCVLQWYWTSANTCSPPGVVEYFEGPNGPKNWGKCLGQGGAIGGFTKVQKNCGADTDSKRYPEEYYQCADVRVDDVGGDEYHSGVKHDSNEGEKYRGGNDRSPIKPSAASTPALLPPSTTEASVISLSATPTESPLIPSPSSTANPSSTPWFTPVSVLDVGTASISASAVPSIAFTDGEDFPPSESETPWMMETPEPSGTPLPSLLFGTFGEAVESTTGATQTASASSNSVPTQSGPRSAVKLSAHMPYHARGVQRYGSVKEIALTCDGNRVASAHDALHFDGSACKRGVSIEAVTDSQTKTVTFFLDGIPQFGHETDEEMPGSEISSSGSFFFVNGTATNRVPRAWSYAVDHIYEIWVIADDDIDATSILMIA